MTIITPHTNRSSTTLLIRLIEDLHARTKYIIHSALAVLVTNEFGASRRTGHENIVLVDHETGP